MQRFHFVLILLFALTGTSLADDLGQTAKALIQTLGEPLETSRHNYHWRVRDLKVHGLTYDDSEVVTEIYYRAAEGKMTPEQLATVFDRNGGRDNFGEPIALENDKFGKVKHWVRKDKGVVVMAFVGRGAYRQVRAMTGTLFKERKGTNDVHQLPGF